MKVCILGEGYIGSRLASQLALSNPQNTYVVVTQSKYDVKYPQNVQKIISKYHNLPPKFYAYFDVFILLAGQSKTSECNGLLATLYQNIVGFAYLVDNIKDHQKLIYASSAGVYGDTKGYAVDETRPTTPSNLYDIFKATNDNISNVITDSSSKQIFALRLGTTNGWSPIPRSDLLINKMIHDAKSCNKVLVSSNDLNRSVLGVNDLCRAIQVIIDNGCHKNTGLYNLASFNTSVHQLGTYVANQCGVRMHMTGISNSPYNFHMDILKFKKTFSFTFMDTMQTITDEMLSNNTTCIVETQSSKTSQRSYTMEENCRVCKTQTIELLNLGEQPLANSYHTEYEILDRYPLCLHYCPHCFHVQLNCTVDPNLLFKNYLYVSGTSNTGKQYFKSFAQDVLTRYMDIMDGSDNIQPTIKVLDIACNDGSQLDAFIDVAKNMNINVITTGVDPAENLHSVSTSKGHDVFCGFFNDDAVNYLSEKYGTFDLVIAQNVFAHINYPNDFLSMCKKIMHANSLLYIQTSQAKMIQNHEFDTAYHEHLSFFSTNSMKYLCDKNELFLNRVDLKNIHGTSYVFEITTKTTNDSNVVNVLLDEMDESLYAYDTYNKYPLACKMYSMDFHKSLLQAKHEGFNIIGFGSTAKSNTLLNYNNIDNDLIDFIIDENALKQGMLTPGGNIPIMNVDILATLKDEEEKYLIVVFAWNFFDEIYEKLTKLLIGYGVTNKQITVLNINPISYHHICL